MINYQFNKTSLGDWGKQLKVRQRALPTIKSKESALRMEVKRAKDRVVELEAQLSEMLHRYDTMAQLWGEFDTRLVRVEDVDLKSRKIAGVVIPELDQIKFVVEPFNRLITPTWIVDGVEVIRQLVGIGIEREVFARKQELLEHSRKKTTQKVNLYEKVQIPGYEEAILKIKRFLEDEENISKSSQKIIKSRI